MKLELLYKKILDSTGVSTDTRKISPGNLFFALSGDRFDGNAFAAEALKKGCTYAVVDKKEYAVNDHYILVDNCLTALQRLATYHRDKLKIPFIGITGTNGKTTTKELIAAVLGRKYKVLYTQGNLNNHIGVPLTILKVTQDTEIAIIEMGANHPGEIDFLCKIAKPTHGIITNIGKAHLEGFGGFDGVKKTKNELYQYVIAHQGTLFVNSGNEILTSLLKDNSVKKVYYGESENSGCSGEIVKSDPYLQLKITGLGVVDTKLAGRYNFENVLAAACLGIFFQVPSAEIKTALENYEPSNQRSQIKLTSKNMLLMDYYNANPSSMEAALENFDKLDHPRKAVILGDMLELGDETAAEHLKIINQTRAMNLEKIILVGASFSSLPQAEEVIYFENSLEAKEWLTHDNLNNYLILIKGSRGIQLEVIADIL